MNTEWVEPETQLIGHVQVIEMVRIRQFGNREVNNGFKEILNILSGKFLCKNVKKRTSCVGNLRLLFWSRGWTSGSLNRETLYMGNIVLFSQLP